MKIAVLIILTLTANAGIIPEPAQNPGANDSFTIGDVELSDYPSGILIDTHFSNSVEDLSNPPVSDSPFSTNYHSLPVVCLLEIEDFKHVNIHLTSLKSNIAWEALVGGSVENHIFRLQYPLLKHLAFSFLRTVVLII